MTLKASHGTHGKHEPTLEIVTRTCRLSHVPFLFSVSLPLSFLLACNPDPNPFFSSYKSRAVLRTQTRFTVELAPHWVSCPDSLE